MKKTRRNINIYFYINMYASKLYRFCCLQRTPQMMLRLLPMLLLLLLFCAAVAAAAAATDAVSARVFFIRVLSFSFFLWSRAKKCEFAVCISLSNVFICRHLLCAMILGPFVLFALFASSLIVFRPILLAFISLCRSLLLCVRSCALFTVIKL